MVHIYTDGSARPANPGPCGCAFVMYDKSDVEIYAESAYLGINSNNYAEYKGILNALVAARELNFTNLVILSDSELAVKQINGVYKVNNKALRTLKLSIDAIIPNFNNIKFVHTKAHCGTVGNERADILASEAARTRSSRKINMKASIQQKRRLHMQATITQLDKKCFELEHIILGMREQITLLKEYI